MGELCRSQPNSARSGRHRGRPKLGDCRIQIMLPRWAYDELRALESPKQGGPYRTRIAAQILVERLRTIRGNDFRRDNPFRNL
jgi:hypothetical protein